jgi:hypothetical protein
LIGRRVGVALRNTANNLEDARAGEHPARQAGKGMVDNVIRHVDQDPTFLETAWCR